jgi:predicted acyl esterase
MRRTTAGAGIVIEKNVSVMMPDGVTLRLNVFRPRDVVAPVVMSVNIANSHIAWANSWGPLTVPVRVSGARRGPRRSTGCPLRWALWRRSGWRC